LTRTRFATVAMSLSFALVAAESATAAQPSRTILNDRAHHPAAAVRLSEVQLNDRIHHVTQVRPGSLAVVSEQAPSRFDWGAAAIGALGAFGLCLLAAAGIQLAARERRRQAAA
jgi:hypothetical protein